jgi:hypothetical protein
MIVWLECFFITEITRHENHSTYEELLAKSILPSLKIRRIRSIAIETFKIINKETPQYLHYHLN